MRRLRSLAAVLVLTGLVAGCGDSQVASYRQDHKAFLKELIYCENHYDTQRDTPACRAAFKVNAELFPG